MDLSDLDPELVKIHKNSKSGSITAESDGNISKPIC